MRKKKKKTDQSEHFQLLSLVLAIRTQVERMKGTNRLQLERIEPTTDPWQQFSRDQCFE
jgi:hypothetical protein